MARLIRSEAELSQILARPGFKIASQIGGEKVDTAPEPASKYGNVKTDGYDSKKEAKRAAELKALERAHKIKNLREQVEYLLIPKYTNADGSCQERPVKYKADFVYDDENGNPIVEDCKGLRTRDYIIKRKLMLMVHGIKIKET